MKNIFLLFIIAFLSLTTKANLFRVNNNFGIGANFTDLQAAHNAAANGDTIYVESSATSYGSVTCSKQFVWIGMGYFLDPSVSSDYNQGLQFHIKSSWIDYITFTAGSEYSKIMGMSLYSVRVQTNNITVERCNSSTIELYAYSPNLASNFLLNQCFITGSVVYTYINYYNPTAQNSTGFSFQNNIILGSLTLPAAFLGVIVNSNYIHQLNTVAFVVSNNVINGANSASNLCVYPSNVYNNLFMSITNPNYVGNNGNIFNSGNPASSNAVFVGSVVGSYDSWANLKPGSPAVGTGWNGINIGPRGGATPYKLSGIPNVPSISQFLFRSTPSNILPVTISTRSNN